MNGAESLVSTLASGGVDTCFANPGTSEIHLVAALDGEGREVAAVDQGDLGPQIGVPGNGGQRRERVGKPEILEGVVRDSGICQMRLTGCLPPALNVNADPVDSSRIRGGNPRRIAGE